MVTQTPAIVIKKYNVPVSKDDGSFLLRNTESSNNPNVTAKIGKAIIITQRSELVINEIINK